MAEKSRDGSCSEPSNYPPEVQKIFLYKCNPLTSSMRLFDHIHFAFGVNSLDDARSLIYLFSISLHSDDDMF